MFGYVRAYKPEMKIAEFDTYKAIYCSLCRKLGKRYGALAQSSLSYDFTFLLALLLSLEPQCCGYRKMRCRYNPLKKCIRLDKESESLEYTAACLVCSAYYKIVDNIEDSGFFKRMLYRLLKLFYSRHRKKAANLYPQVDEACQTMMVAQRAAEQCKTDSLDAAAEPTAVFLRRIFTLSCPDKAKRIMGRIGYCAGKAVYLLDAIDDLRDDIKSGGYNPIAVKYKLYGGADLESARKEAACLVKFCITELAACFELLDIYRYKGILGNVIYLGMPKMLEKLTKDGESAVMEDRVNE